MIPVDPVLPDLIRDTLLDPSAAASVVVFAPRSPGPVDDDATTADCDVGAMDRLLRSAFAVTPGNRPLVEEIERCIDALPLGVELPVHSTL